jgi:hypothetical protein
MFLAIFLAMVNSDAHTFTIKMAFEEWKKTNLWTLLKKGGTND